MDKLHIASESLNHAQLKYERDYNEQIFAFSQRESRLQDRKKKLPRPMAIAMPQTTTSWK
jgi:hypothetical protein